jgi:hypothetical protein
LSAGAGEEDSKMSVIQAIAKLGAVKVADGYAYRDDGMRRYYVVSEGGLAVLDSMLANGMPDAYSLWCALTIADEMPVGYEPSEVAS